VTGSYTADIIDVPSHGIRLRPEHGADVPRAPSEQNLLALAIALALGAAGYEHHPEPRDPGLQTIDALLEGHTTAPWRTVRADGDGPAAGPAHAVVCQRSKSASWSCHVEDR
jgi:hypothetical protein